MHRTFTILLFTLILLVRAADSSPLEWSQLKPLPDEHGFAGAFAGVSNDALIVAGGANFPDGYPWEGGAKRWHDAIYILETPEGDWRKSEQALPRPLAYGVSITLPTRNSVLFIGGNDDETSYPTTYEVTYRGGEIAFKELPPLPVTMAMGCGALIGDSVYIAGGTMDGTVALKAFNRLDFSAENLAWETLAWPAIAPARILSVAGVSAGKFYLFGGADLGSNKWDKRTYLNDAYAFDPSTDTWQRLADLPTQITAGPSLAISTGQSHLILLGGASRAFVDGQRALRPDINGQGHEHPGFPRTLHAYHTITDTWAEMGAVPEGSWAPVTTSTLQWQGRTIIPTGEIKPGVRSPQILASKIASAKRDFGLINWIVIATYLGGMVLIGYWFSKRNKSTDDYFRGGQRILWFLKIDSSRNHAAFLA